MLPRKGLAAIFFLLLISASASAQDLSHLWSRGFGDSEHQFSYGVATDAWGNVIIIGTFRGTVDFGGGPLVSERYYEIFVAKFNPSGNHIWSQRNGDAGYATARSVAVDLSGNIIIAGYFMGTMDFGGGVLTSAGQYDIFVAKFNSKGNHIWSQSFGDSDWQNTQSITVDETGNVIFTGYFKGTVDFGGGALTSAGQYDIYVAKLDPNGNHIWSQSFGYGGDQQARSVTTDSFANIIITGNFEWTVDFGGGPLRSAGGFDIFVAKFDKKGNHIWSERFGDSTGQFAQSAAVDGLSNVFLTGFFWGTVDFGGGILTSSGENDIFVAKFDKKGKHIWSERFGDSDEQLARSVAIDDSGNVIITGKFAGTVDFGGGALMSSGSYDIFIAKSDPNGKHIWSQRFGDPSSQSALGVAVNGSDNIIVTGHYYGTVNFGGGPLTAAGSGDIFVAEFGSLAIPAMTGWGYLVLVLLLAFCSIFFLKQRMRRSYRMDA